ncbi:SH3 domain-containing protein [Rhodotorula paludigena]|uniref:SH3 domain-containing protein n=1 Tax=Rhodotorula paludigena TaxID=86838 RepID=UPI003177CAEC
MAERRSPSPAAPAPKRRRIRASPPADAPAPLDEFAGTTRRILGFHRSLQERSFRPAFRCRQELDRTLARIEDLEATLVRNRKDHEEHGERVRDSLHSIQRTLASVTDASRATRRLSSEATAIGADVADLAKRCSRLHNDVIHPRYAYVEGGTQVLLLDKQTHDSLGETVAAVVKSTLFDGLFSSVVFENVDDQSAGSRWDEVSGSTDLDDNSRQLAHSWGAIFTMADPVKGCWTAPSVLPIDDKLVMDWSIYTAIRSYDAKRDDEIDIKVGDRVLIRERGSRRYFVGSVISESYESLRTGMLPFTCFKTSLDTLEHDGAQSDCAVQCHEAASQCEDPLFSTPFDPSPPRLVDSTARYASFRAALSTVLRLVATSQLERMLAANERLAALAASSEQVRAENEANGAREAELVEERDEARHGLVRAMCARDELQRTLEEHVSMLVILSKGP